MYRAITNNQEIQGKNTEGQEERIIFAWNSQKVPKLYWYINQT